MKKIYNLILLITLVLPTFASATTAYASNQMQEGVFTFEDLGLEDDMVLNGPYDSGTLRFSLPPTWQLKSGSVLELDVTSYFVGNNDSAQSNGNTLVGAVLEVYFNDKLIQSIPLASGNNVVYQVPIPDDALASPSDEGWHKIDFFLDAAVDCDFDYHKTTVLIDVKSKALLQYDLIPLSLDLRKLPWPFYQDLRKQNDPVAVVIPDAPTAEEMQSVLVVMGTFARMTGGKLPLTMISIGQLTDDIKAQTHLLMVGKAASFPVLDEFSLPVPLDGEGFYSAEGTDEDGVIQAIPSPWNTERAILIVSGATDSAVVKSAQALSTMNLQTGVTPDYSIVAEVNPVSSLGVQSTDLTQFNSPDITFGDLGFESIDISGMGENWISYEFFIPPGQVPSEDPYLDIKYSVSDLVDPLRSEGVVYLNDIRIGGIPLESDTSNLINARIDIPLSALRPGENNLDVVLNLIPKDDCSSLAFSGIWATLYSESLLHMPLVMAEETSFALQDLRAYPYPFSNDPSLDTTTLVLSQQDPTSWLEAGRVAYDLGARILGSIISFTVMYDGQIKDEYLNNHLIIIGQPKNLTILSGIKDSMPAYFEDGSNIAVLESQQVVYRISDEKDLGYLELFASPWTEQKAVLGIFGTSSVGLGYAVTGLLDPNLRDQLTGDFATLDGTSVIIVDTRTGMGLGRVDSNPNIDVEVVKTVTPAPVASNAEADFARSRQFIMIAVVAVIAMMVVVLIVTLVLRKRRL